MKVHYIHSTHNRTLIGVLLLLLTVSGGIAWWPRQASASNALIQQAVPTKTDRTSVALQPQAVPSQSQEATIPIPTEQPTSSNKSQVEELQPEFYWLRVDGQQISLVPQHVAINADLSPEQALIEGVVNLLTNSKTGNQSSAIPTGTHLMSLRVTSQGIYVNLSHEFRQGGGSNSMIHRVAQILHTVTSLDPNAKVYLSVEGQALDENYPLGGEGLILKQPLTRQQFAEDFSLS